MIYSRKFISYIEKLSKDVCNDAQNEEMHGNPDGIEYFTALVCGEPLPEFSDDGGDDEGPSKETMCYFFNYERFAHHVAGPDDGDVPTIMPAGFLFVDDLVDDVDPHCVMEVDGDEEVDRVRDCDCSNPREFMKNMFNKGMFFMLKNLLNEISH